VEVATSLSSRLVGLVVLVVSVYVSPDVIVFGKGTSAEIWMVWMVANKTSRRQTRTLFDRSTLRRYTLLRRETLERWTLYWTECR